MSCGRGDGVTSGLTGVAGAEPLADQHASPVQAGEELLLAGRPGGCGADGPPERDAGGLAEFAAASLLCLGSGRAARGGAITRSGAPEPETLLRRPACLADTEIVVPGLGTSAVLAGQYGHDMDVIRGMPDRDPADRVVFLPVRGQAGAVHDVAGDLRPLVIGEGPVFRGSPDGAVPHRARRSARAEGGVRLLEQAVQVAEVATTVVA